MNETGRKSPTKNAHSVCLQTEYDIKMRSKIQKRMQDMYRYVDSHE